MSLKIPRTKPLTLGILACLLFRVGLGAPPSSTLLITGQRVDLHPYWVAVEDPTGILSPSDWYKHSGTFVPLDSLEQGSPTSYYWLKTTIHATSGMTNADQVLSFHHLTYVDVYLFQDSTQLLHKQVGQFRENSAIAEGDGRLYSILPMKAGGTYTLLLRVHHTKHFKPNFDFILESRRSFFQQLHIRIAVDSALQGAAAIFLIYTLLSWIVSGYKPYRGLAIFIIGIGLYVCSMGGYLLEWFFPENPATGWLLNMHFLNLGLFGLYLLVLDFWQLKTMHPQAYRYGKWIPAFLAASSISAFIIDFTTGNYKLASLTTLWEHPIMQFFTLFTLIKCWPRLSHAQRYLAYGIMLLGLMGLTITISTTFLHERILPTIVLFSDGMIMAIFLLFSTGIKEEMRRNEADKQVALRELNSLQQHQNTLLEQKVTERTEELSIANRRLQKQKHILTERHAKIETLMDELNHRVKNNLQLLYSLLSLQLPIVKDGASRDILKGNIGKIRAMMLVNQKLLHFEQGNGVCLGDFVSELAAHLQKIYDTREKTRILQDIPSGIELSNKHTLSFGLILSELLTNTFKHAFQDHPNPCIYVKAIPINDRTLQFEYTDNGVGITGDDAGEKFTMGIPLVKDLTRQMNGQMTIAKENGLSYSFTIPV